MENGKCEDCGAPTRVGKDGKQQNLCWECYKKAHPLPTKTSPTMPVRSAQESVAEICSVFKMSFDWVKATFPLMPGEVGTEVAIAIMERYYKNDRRPQ